MTPRELNELILKEFPEIVDEFNKYTSWQEGIDTGSFLIVEDVLMKYIYKELEDNNQELLAKFVNFIEKVYLLNDPYACNVIAVGIIENIKCSIFSNEVYNHLLGETKRVYDEIEV